MKLVIATFLTLDGVMQAPGGPDEDREGGFKLGGWQMPYVDEEAVKIITDGIARTDAFLLGRKTYDIFAGYWPNQTEPAQIAGPLNERPKYVPTRTLDKAEWHNTTLLKGDVVDEVQRLKALPGQDIQIIGSGDLAQTLMRANLIDEYRLFVHPVVLGSGRKLFNEGATPAALKLIESHVTSTGVTCNTYVPAGEPRYGVIDASEAS